MDICTGQKRGIYRAKTRPLDGTAGGPMTPLDIAELVSIVRDTRAFNKGDGIYNFSRLSSLQRACAAVDAWHGCG